MSLSKNHNQDSPIFILARPRTGGTLLTTILDAHPDIAMSYEIYEELLVDKKGRYLTIDKTFRVILKALSKDENLWVKNIKIPKLKTFVARMRRAGISLDDFVDCMNQFRKDEKSFLGLDERLDFIEMLMKRKRRNFSKTKWGGKVKVSPYKLYERYPNAVFFAMLRDGRDVLASRLHTGSFNTSAREVAYNWRRNIHEFCDFLETTNANGQLVHYEKLVKEPHEVLSQLCVRMNVHFSTDMLQFHTKNMPLFKNPHGHLSYNQLLKGINQESIGRWKQDLTQEELKIFSDINLDLLEKYGYLSFDS